MKDNKEIKEPLITPNQLFNLWNAQGEAPDTSPREQAYTKLVEYLHDKSKLLMTSRLTEDFTYYMLKHLIVRRHYYNYYKHIKIKYTFTETDKPPLYKVNVDVNKEHTLREFKASYDKLIEEMLQLTISFKGLGREELIRVIESVDRRLHEEEMRQLNQRGIDLRERG